MFFTVSTFSALKMIMMQFVLEILHKISSVYFEGKEINHERKVLLDQLLVQAGAERKIVNLYKLGGRGGGMN